MSLVSRVAAMTSKAWGQFKTGAVSLAGNYLYLWGSNSTSALGTGMLTSDPNNSSSPVQISIRKSYAVISAGTSVSGITTSGELWSWGNGALGQLGDGTVVSKSSPVQIGTLTNWADISVGDSFSTAIKTDGTLWAWGSGTNGRLGDGTSLAKSSPIQIGTLTNWARTSSSYATGYTLAVKTDGTLWAWGLGTNGYLGDGTTINKSSPIQIGTLTNWLYVYAGASGPVAIKTDGTLWAWGFNSQGRIGDGTTLNKSSPVQIGTLTTWANGGSGSQNSYAVKTDGTFWAWGQNNLGQVGDGTTTDRSSPVQIGTLTNWSTQQNTISGSVSSVMAIKADGTIWAWGRDSNGSFGLGDTTSRSSPTQIGTSTNNSKVTGKFSAFFWSTTNYANYGAGANTFMGRVQASNPSVVEIGNGITDLKYASVASLNAGGAAVDTTGKLWAWGNNATGLLGQGDTTTSVSFPIQVGTLTNWRSVYPNLYNTSGGSAAIAVNSTGALYGWGSDELTRNYLLGYAGTTSNGYPVQFTPLTMSEASGSNSGHSLFVTSSGALYALGNNDNGQIGNGTTVTASAIVRIGTLSNWAKVATAASCSMAIKTDGTLWGWGLNSRGQLGTGNTVSYSSPVQIGTLTNWVDIEPLSLGFTATNSSGELYAWGCANDGSTTLGQYPQLPLGVLADDSSTSRQYPKQFGQFDFTDASYGNTDTTANSALGVDSSGRLWGWGNNSFGQVGDGTTTARNSQPVQIGTLTNWSKVWSSSGSTSMAIKTDGTLWAWGKNNVGQLGLGGQAGTGGSLINYSSPIQMAFYEQIEDLYEKSFCGTGTGFAKINGELWGWGMGNVSILGQDPYSVKFSNQMATSLVNTGFGSGWSQISCGQFSVYGIKDDGTLWAWGTNSGGQLGLGDTVDRSSPVQIGTLTDWTDISAGLSCAYAVRSDGTLWSWGLNSNGQLGQGNTTNLSSPVQIGTLTNWSKAFTGDLNAFFTTTGNALYAVGDNYNGSLGIGDTTNRSSPVQVGTLTNWAYVSGGDEFTTAVKTDGTLWTWGTNNRGQLGLGDIIARYSPVQVGTLTTWSKVRADFLSASAIKTDGTLWSWGRNSSGQLGIGDAADRSSPVQVGTQTYWSKLFRYMPNQSTGAGGFAALTTSKTMFAAGYNTNATEQGYLGANYASTQLSPVQVGSQTNWDSVVATTSAGVAIKTTGALWSWGQGLAQGSIQSAWSPVQVGTLTNWSKINAGVDHVMAIKTDGTLWGWGLNNLGQLGLGDITNRSSPVQVGTLTNWSSLGIAPSASSSAAINDAGTMFAWGYNGQGNLGDGTTTNRSSPVQIATSVASVSAGAEILGYVKTDGSVFNTGYTANTGGSSATTQSSPVQVVSVTTYDTTFIRVAVRYYAAKANDTKYIYTWGIGTSAVANNYPAANITVYALGVSSPVQVGTLTSWTNPSGIVSPGVIYTWGYNATGQLGLGDTLDRLGPIKLGTLTNWSKLSRNSGSTRDSSNAIKSDGTLWSWGSNSNGRLGIGSTTNQSAPAQVGTLTTWSDVAAHPTNSYFLNNSGQVWAAGPSTNLENGNGSTISRSSPVQVAYTTDTAVYTKVFAGNAGGFALANTNYLYSWGGGTGQSSNNPGVYSPTVANTETGFTTPYIKSGGLYMFGENSVGQLGTGDTFNRSLTRIGTLTNWKKIQSGGFTIGLKTDGTLWSWGSNTVGQLGQGNTTNRSSPVQIGTLTNWADFSIGTGAVLAVKTDGTLWSWGRNSEGQLGSGTTANRSSPVQVGTLTDWSAVNLYVYQASAVKTDGTLWTWGQNAGGYGDGTTTARSSPVQIGTLTTWAAKAINSGNTRMVYSTV